jgi:DNA-binding transcriptional LysR family regulator
MKKSAIDFNAMTTLLAVVKAGGFSAAARQLGVPANRIRQIQVLEGNLGFDY